MSTKDKYYLDQYGAQLIIQRIAQTNKELRDYIDASLFDRGKIYPTSITVTAEGTYGKITPLKLTVKFPSTITDDNNPYKSGAKGLHVAVDDGTVIDVDYSDITVSGDTMTANVDYTTNNLGEKKITATADINKSDTIKDTIDLTPIQIVELTFESNADTTVPVYYTKESFVNGTPDETISLKANERKTTIINKPEIYRFGVTQYDPTTLKRTSINTAITFAGVKGTVLDGIRLFDSATGLVDVDLTYLDTSKMTNMNAMFQGCINLTALNVSNFDTSNVTSMIYMFGGYGDMRMKLSTLDVSHFDTSKVTNMWGIFCKCPNLTTLDVSHFDTSNVTNMKEMFYECSNLTTLDVSNWDTSKVTDMDFIFSECSNLTTLDISNWNTSNVTNMSSMFQLCSSLITLDVSKWDTSKVTDMSYMFNRCNNLTILDISNWDTSKVTDMGTMFQLCSSLITLDVSKWDTSNVTSMRYIFCKCPNLTTLDISNWNTSNVTNMEVMFDECSKLTALDISKWDTSKVTTMYGMFNECSNLSTLGPIDTASGWQHKPDKYDYMFDNCPATPKPSWYK